MEQEQEKEREREKSKIKILCFISLFEFILFDYYLFKFFFHFERNVYTKSYKNCIFSYFKLEFLLKFSLTEIIFSIYLIIFKYV